MSGWCDDSVDWFTDIQCIATYADIIAPNDFIFMESFYTDAAGPYEQIGDFDGDGFDETLYWTHLDHWLTGDWYNVQTGNPFTVDWPIGAKADIFDRLSATKKALVWAGVGSNWGNATWCLTNYGPSPGTGELLPAGDISNCTNADAYCDYSVNCPIWDENSDMVYDFMDTTTCVNWCDGAGGCVDCQTNPQNTSNCYYSNCLPVDGCHGGTLGGNCYDVSSHMNIADCIISYGDVCASDTCFNGGSHMNITDCTISYGDVCASDTCFNGGSHMNITDCIISYGDVCSSNTCFTSASHMNITDCTISYGDVCSSNTCFTSASHFNFQNGALCTDLNDGNGGVCQDITEYCGISEFDDCDSTCWLASCPTWIESYDSDNNGVMDYMFESSCTPTYTCASNTCFNSGSHMNITDCIISYGDVCSSNTCFDGSSHMNITDCIISYGDVCSSNTCFDGSSHMNITDCTISYGDVCSSNTCFDGSSHMNITDCTISYGDVCSSNTCYDDTIHMLDTDCLPSYTCPVNTCDGGGSTPAGTTCTTAGTEDICGTSGLCTATGQSEICYDTDTHMVEADCISSYACTGGYLNGGCYDTDLHMVEADCIISYGDVCASDTCFDSSTHIEKDDITVDYCTTPSNIYDANGNLISTQLYTSETCTSQICNQTAPDDFTFLTLFYGTPGAYDDESNPAWLDLDAWILATATADSYLGDTLAAHCIGTDISGDGLYNDQSWCTDTYTLDTTWCQSSFTLIPKIDYTNYEIEFVTDGNYQVLSYPLAPEFSGNINTSGSCNFLTILDESYTGTFVDGDTLIITKGGAGQYILIYSGGWGATSTFLTFFNDNPVLGVIFKTNDTGTKKISWALNSECGGS